MNSCNRINFEVFNNSTEHLIVVMSPMELPIDKLPHYKDENFDNFSRILINPGSRNYYKDCVAEVRDAISTAIKETGAKHLVFCGSSMGAFGAIYMGSLFVETKYIVAYAPFIRLDHPGTLSKSSIDPDFLMDEDRNSSELTERLKNTKAKVFLFYPCIDGQDGVKIAESEAFNECAHIARYYLMCEHNIHQHIGLPALVADLIDSGKVSTEKIEQLAATEDDKKFSQYTYQFYIAELENSKITFEFPSMPLENTKNWLYFYWKARYQARQEQHWESLCNYMVSMSNGGDNVVETHFCVANTLKTLGLKHAALGYYQEAFKRSPMNNQIALIISDLLTA
ncbi:hypothetical protein [Massilia sp. CFBP9026]|uniref:hypothetical protein n=1 Tax=Massilia sp. CFBP9026 TaxID=3096536 RepID=UPI002A6AF4E6|nr:hypothetical protein [Massilia sp. CFBP9026]MDY0962493.1 hypothetical protein [Massilia sp. CFBP9026]